ncbi:transcriptional coactivator/pterin dehydratase [Bimuria novae-zelandiae CBS 107.79]|uniref:4a-hydroxytetrahydrobiopterin dehydratase n=1 Tax=Bimuria novae-zelandiae CBS 107.79 TaxID=1447943 RepID=A0A6A5VBL4_9PLEO|nr:transcriptional coactivator/pterin dehydratase [Bimuria novae-zelandiae CBS 107.79]
MTGIYTRLPQTFGRVSRVGPCAFAGRPKPWQLHSRLVHLRRLVVASSAFSSRTQSASQSFSTSPFPGSSESSSSGDKFAGVIFSADQPPELPQRLSQLIEWTLLPPGKGISRQFTFPGFASAWQFMSIVAEECKAKKHHPSWHNLYNKVTVEWTTHKPEGLSMKDVEMAEFCDRTAGEIGLKKIRASGTAT